MERYSKVILALIGINILMFILAANDVTGSTETLSLYYIDNERFGIWQFATHIFMHGGFMHLLVNMFGLLMFGTPIEQTLGTRRFLIFYFISGLGAALFYLVINYYQFQQVYQILVDSGLEPSYINNMLASQQYPPSLLSEEQAKTILGIYHVPMVGASGALYGTLAAVGVLFPETKVALIFLPVPIPAKYFIPVLISIDIILGITGYPLFGMNVAHFAHVGGALTGFLLILYWRRY